MHDGVGGQLTDDERQVVRRHAPLTGGVESEPARRTHGAELGIELAAGTVRNAHHDSARGQRRGPVNGYHFVIDALCRRNASLVETIWRHEASNRPATVPI